MTSPPPLRVLITGAGIAGPCLAYWLTRTPLSLSITILERSPTPRVTGQAIDIRGRAIRVIQSMGLESAVRACHTTEEGTCFVDAGGTPFAAFASTDSEDSFTAEYEILRADLSRLLLEKTAGRPDVRYLYGDSVQSLEQTESEVRVRFAKGGGRSESFDVLVAADGNASRTRALFLDERMVREGSEFMGQYIAFFSIPRREEDGKVWKWYSAPRGLAMMTRPHRTPETMGAYLSITMPAREVSDPAVDEALEKGTAEEKKVLRAYFKDAGWEAERLLDGMDAADDFYMSRATLVRIPKWRNGRAIVLGDAALATFGIGTSLAIESAYVLAGELGKIRSADEVASALQRYEEVYRPVYEKIGGMPSVFPQWAAPQTAWGLWLRNSLLWAVSKSKVYRLFQGGKEKEADLPEYEWKGDV